MPIGPTALPAGPGVLQPFTMTTPHHAPAALGMTGGAGDENLAGVTQQMLELDAAIAEAHAAAARANADAARLQMESDALASAYDQALKLSGGGS